MEGFLIGGWELILPGCGGTSALARGATLAARWLHESQPISNHPLGLEFPHPAGQYRPGVSAFSSPRCWSRIYGRVSDPGVGTYPSLVRWDLGGGPRGNSRRAPPPGAQDNQQSPSMVGIPHSAGRYRPKGCAFSPPGCWNCGNMEGFLTRGWEIILPGCGGTSALSRGATLAARWLHEPQPISNHPVGLGFPHLAGRYRPGESASPGWSCRDLEGFLTRGWEIILPGVRWLYVRSPAYQRSAGGTGVSTPCGTVRPGGSPFLFPGCRSCGCMEGFLMWRLYSIVPGWRWLSSRALANQRSAGGVGVSTPCGSVSTRGITIFVPVLS